MQSIENKIEKSILSKPRGYLLLPSDFLIPVPADCCVLLKLLGLNPLPLPKEDEPLSIEMLVSITILVLVAPARFLGLPLTSSILLSLRAKQLDFLFCISYRRLR
jgi:hypothetical protein